MLHQPSETGNDVSVIQGSDVTTSEANMTVSVVGLTLLPHGVSCFITYSICAGFTEIWRCMQAEHRQPLSHLYKGVNADTIPVWYAEMTVPYVFLAFPRP